MRKASKEDISEGSENMKTTAIVLSAGSGKRMGADIPKQYMQLSGYPVIYYCLKTFEDSFIDEIILVCGAEDIEMCRRDIVEKYNLTKVKAVVAGGRERYHSVAYGLRACSDDCDYVFIHDGARPFVDEGILSRSLACVKEWGSAIAAVPSKDTVKIADADGFAVDTPSRDTVWLMQTPQTFIYRNIKACYERLLELEGAAQTQASVETELSVQAGVSVATEPSAQAGLSGLKITDDAMVMEYFGRFSEVDSMLYDNNGSDKNDSDLAHESAPGRIKLSEGSYRNIKITTPEDMLIAEALLRESVCGRLYGKN